jgi:hypothetical protein
MKTNYNNLTSFEACIILIAVVGVALIGVQIYVSLSRTQQVAITDAFSMFDMHQEFAKISDNTQFTLGVMQSFYDQFDVAFVQTFSYPDLVGTPVMKFTASFENYSQSVALGYKQNNISNDENVGQVLGAFTIGNDSTVQATQTLSTGAIENAITSKQYYYHAPGLVQQLLK